MNHKNNTAGRRGRGDFEAPGLGSKVYHLPFDPEGEKGEKAGKAGGARAAGKGEPVIIRAYSSQCNSNKNKIMLHRNMINLLISSKKTLILPEGITTIHEGELLILSCGNCLTSEVLPAGKAFASILIYFDNTWLADFLVKYDGNGRNGEVAQPGFGGEREPFLVFKQDAFISHYIDSLRLMLQSPVLPSPAFRQLKLEELLLYLLDKDPAKLRSLAIMAKNEEDLLLRKVIESNVCNPVTVEELAFLCNASLSAFKRNFRKVYGTSPQKWLLQRRLEIAAGLLKHPDQRPGLVYMQVGYENHSSFSQSFKKQYGLTPKEYQDQNPALQL